jgi:glycosyltransferase involved in cell wall biosynthesis
VKVSIVLTTINVPNLLKGYADNFEKYGHKKDDIEVIVVGDKKTPEAAKEPVQELKKRGFGALYLDIPAQEDWLKKFPDLKAIIPYNSDNRRNIGYLMAAERGAEIIISIDDDNYATENEDFIAGHKIIGTTQQLKTVRSSNKWFNLCSLLETEPSRTIYPRGYPYSKRWKDEASFTSTTGKVMLNAGLWLDEPDVDAVTWLNQPIKSVKVKPGKMMLEPGTYTAVNTQNTAFHRDVLPCYYFVTMNAVINGTKIDRYGDIWSGFFAVKVVQSQGHYVSFGAPTARHIRNKHNYLKDLQNELGGMVLTEALVPVIESAQLKAKTYGKAYVELSQKIDELVAQSQDFGPEARNYMSQVTGAMRIWVDVCDEILK